MASGVSQPAPRDIGAEFEGIADASGSIFDKALDFSQEFADLALAYYPRIAEAERRATRWQRRDDTRDLKRIGPRTRRALEAISPEWAAAQDALGAEIARAQDGTALRDRLNLFAIEGLDQADAYGPSALRSELERQALGELKLEGELSAADLRGAEQQARAAFADRGLADSQPAFAAEVLSRDAFTRQREAERRQFAAGVQGLAQREDEGNINKRIALGNLGVGVENLNNLGSDRIMRLLGASQSTLNPVLGVFGRTPVSPLAGGGLLQGSSGLIQGFAPLLSYGSDLYNTNFNAGLAVDSANAQANNAMIGAGIEAGGAVLGALGGLAFMCWVARGVLGITRTVRFGREEVPAWMVFRHWLVTEAPRPLLALYLWRGRAFARWLRRRPAVRAALQPWFERTVQTHALVLNARLFHPLYA